MPLLQFLAFYQTIEFYFPVYSQREAQLRVQNMLKEPTFNIHNAADISRLLSFVKVNANNRGYGDEKNQLMATLRDCLDAAALWAFLEKDEQRKEAFSSKSKSLTQHKLPLNNAYSDIRENVAIRIYDIRCKIVHTKSSSENEEIDLLLPYSKEAESLSYDITLIQYVAQQVLIASSRELSF